MKGNKRKSKKGFTLIELLVVIAIIAILSVVVILSLNPAELLRQSRDSNRISDLSVTKSAIAFYLASVSSPYLATSTALATTCYVDAQGVAANQSQEGTSTCAAWFLTNTTGLVASVTPANQVLINGYGWIPINFTLITAGGSPIASLPHDPVNNDGEHFYSYIASTTGLSFKLAAKMESAKYSNTGSNDVESTDGGTDANMYEQGSNLQL